MSQLTRDIADSGVVGWPQEVIEAIPGEGRQSNDNRHPGAATLLQFHCWLWTPPWGRVILHMYHGTYVRRPNPMAVSGASSETVTLIMLLLSDKLSLETIYISNLTPISLSFLFYFFDIQVVLLILNIRPLNTSTSSLFLSSLILSPQFFFSLKWSNFLFFLCELSFLICQVVLPWNFWLVVGCGG